MSSGLNLARKLRPKNFDQIVGQQIQIKMLQNSLFLKKLFPVYLFAGQRGCGKTTTARVFGSAINCKNLSKFQENPSENKVPCLECDSCKAMLSGNHPDFIEIDAASNTGVENVRQILETCSYLPILGSKKIYLIDEAHMLSKAAFNAFLKILEEPPASALFILATTESQKFPETVLSRCFQVIFRAITHSDLKDYLKTVCSQENIAIEDSALDIIIQETEGSARDAINLLERVRFSQTNVTLDSVLQTLGKISEKNLFDIFEILLEQDPCKLLDILSKPQIKFLNPRSLWDCLVQMCRTILWLKFKAENLPYQINDLGRLNLIANKCSLNRLNAIFQLFFSQEDLFLKTSQKQIFLEILLLQICQQTNISDLNDILKQFQTSGLDPHNLHDNFETFDTKVPKTNPTPAQSPTMNNTNKIEQTKTIQSANIIKTEPAEKKTFSEWETFLEKITPLKDPLLITILNQSKFISKDENKKIINIELSNNSQFFKDKIFESKKLWNPIFQESFPTYTDFCFTQTGKQQGAPTVQNPQNSSNFLKPTLQINQNPIKIQPKAMFKPTNSYKKASNITIDVSDQAKWPKASLLTKYFPGKIKSVKNYS